MGKGFAPKNFPSLAKGLLDRFTEEEDITNGRNDLLVDYLRIWVSDAWCVLFGYGQGSYLETTGMPTSPHNGLADILISWGATGLVALCVQWATLFRYSAKRIPKQVYLIAFLPALVDVVGGVAGQYLTTGIPHMRLCFLLLAATSFAKESQRTGET